jgi:uncharacterized repeat protein (TIGR02543 family)
VASASTSLAQHHWVASVTANAHDHNIESFGYAEYVDDYGNDALGYIHGWHCIDQEGGTPFSSGCWQIFEFHHAYSGRFDVWAAVGCHQTGLWAGYDPLSGSDNSAIVQIAHDCVAARTYHLAAYTETNGVTMQSSETGDYPIGTSMSLMASPNPGFQFTGWTGDVTSSEATISVVMDGDKSVTAHFSELPPPPPPDPGHNPENVVDNSGCPAYQNCNSPIIINMGNGPYQLSGSNQPVSFDIDANGTLNRISWTAAGAPMAFLALDRNGNGTINSGAELFGNHTPLPRGVAANGFDALAQYDANSDGVIDASDPIWSSLLLWTDLNHDGISQRSELALLSASAVTAIGLDYHWTGRRDQWGNSFRYESRVWIDGGRKHPTPRPVYDVYFIPAP